MPRRDGTQLSMRVFLLMSAAQKTSKLEEICDPEKRYSFNDLKDLDKRVFLSVNAVKHVENNLYQVLASNEVLWSSSNSKPGNEWNRQVRICLWNPLWCNVISKDEGCWNTY